LISPKEPDSLRLKRSYRAVCQRFSAIGLDSNNNSVSLLSSKTTASSYKLIFLSTFDVSQMAAKINGKGKKRKINSRNRVSSENLDLLISLRQKPGFSDVNPFSLPF
jgi:hypothetical protein